MTTHWKSDHCTHDEPPSGCSNHRALCQVNDGLTSLIQQSSLQLVNVYNPNQYRIAPTKTASGIRTQNPNIANLTCARIRAPHQNNTATGTVAINRSRATEPSHPRNLSRSVAFIVASGGMGCSRANQYRVSQIEQSKSGARVCQQVHWSALCTPGQRAAFGQIRRQNNGLRRQVCSRASRNTGLLVHVLFQPMACWRSSAHSTKHGILGGLAGTCSGIKCGENRTRSRASIPCGSVGPASLPDTPPLRLFGTGWFKWLSWFRAPKIRRSLAIEFSGETGPEKGSWKGGTVGTGIDMRPGELHESAFRRYCGEPHRSKYNEYHVKFVSRVEKAA